MDREGSFFLNFGPVKYIRWLLLNYNIFHQSHSLSPCIKNHIYILTYMKTTGK